MDDQGTDRCIKNSFSLSRIKRLKGHTSYVNSVHPARRGEPMIVSGSDDCMIKVIFLMIKG